MLPGGLHRWRKGFFLERIVLGVVPPRFRRSQQPSYLCSVALLTLSARRVKDSVVPEGLKHRFHSEP